MASLDSKGSALAFILVFLVVIGFMLSLAGFRAWWTTQPDPGQAPPQVEPTMANPSPLEPYTTCTAYGIYNASLKLEAVFKKDCVTQYR